MIEDEFKAVDEHVRAIILRIQQAAQKGKGLRLSSEDVRLLNLTIFIEDNCISEGL